jgi:hypothetical protein
MKTIKKKRRACEPLGFTTRGVVEMAGGAAVVACKLDLTVQAVAKWTRIPGKYAREISIMAGLPLALVRPDLVQDADVEARLHGQGHA